MGLKKLLKTHNAAQSVLKRINEVKACNYKALIGIDENHKIIRYVLLMEET